MKTVLASLCTSILTPVIVCIIFLASLRSILLQPNFYKNILTENNTYQVIHENATELSKQLFKGSQMPIPPDELGAIIQRSTSPQWLQAQIETSIDKFFAWFNGNSSTLDINIDLTSIKSGIASQLKVKPSQIDWPDQFSTNNYNLEKNTALTKTREAGSWYSIGFDVLIGLALLLLLLIVLLKFRSPRRMLQALAWPLFIAGLTTAISVYLGLKLIEKGLLPKINLGKLPNSLANLFTDLIKDFATSWQNQVLIIAGATAAVAFIVLIISLFIHEKEA